MAPRLQALGRAAVGWVEEYGNPAARDATEGRTHGKKRHSVPGKPPEQFHSGLIWRINRLPVT
jgi:hypothetical protein